MTYLTQKIKLDNSFDEKLDILLGWTEQYTRKFLENIYWRDSYFEKYCRYEKETPSNYWKFFEQDTQNPFEDIDIYLYSRYKRCIYDCLREIFDAHKDEYKAYRFILDTVDDNWKIKSVGWRRIRRKLFKKDTEYIPWGVVQNTVEQLNDYYDCHGSFPEKYTEMVSCPSPNGTTSLSPDSRGDIHEITHNSDTDLLEVTLNLPDKESSESYGDWTEHQQTIHLHKRFRDIVELGEFKKPTIHRCKNNGTGYVLDLPIDITGLDTETVDSRVLSVDLGVKQATCTVMQDGDEEVVQLSQPFFLDHPNKSKLFRLKDEAEDLNDKLQQLKRRGLGHTNEFDRVLREYRNVRDRERNLRTQIQHSISNELVLTAFYHGCSKIILEDLASLKGGDGGGGVTSWSISTWARGELLEQTEYKAD